MYAMTVFDPNQQAEYFESLYDKYKVASPKHTQFKTFEAIFNQIVPKKPVKNGKLAPEINLPDPSGQNIALSSLKGKIVLIDFWASWCGPCRAESPNVVRLYQRFKDKGFEIYSVSLDKDKDRWMQAIKDDGLGAWKHVSDLKYWSSVAAKAYGVSGIPATFLLDRNGNVVQQGLRGEDLERAVELLCK
jgi:thiol-disulfide isomerase/thioredoxin